MAHGTFVALDRQRGRRFSCDRNYRPPALGPLNKLWLKLGLMLHKVVNPVIMAVIFYATVLPTGLIMRMLGKDLLRLKLKPGADSYWIPRQPRGPVPESMKDQF